MLISLLGVDRLIVQIGVLSLMLHDVFSQGMVDAYLIPLRLRMMHLKPIDEMASSRIV